MSTGSSRTSSPTSSSRTSYVPAAASRTASPAASSRAHQPEVVTVTTARRSHTDDIALRERRYVAMQLVRVVCILLGVFVPAPLPVRLVLFSGAVFLPWFGVVMANAGPTVEKARPTAVVAHGSLEEPVQRIAIEPGRVVDAE